jgi:hypothetical protein
VFGFVGWFVQEWRPELELVVFISVRISRAAYFPPQLHFQSRRVASAMRAELS